MSLAAVKANVAFSQTDSSSFKNMVYATLEEIYNSSAQAAAILEQSLRAPLSIFEVFGDTGSGALPNGNWVRLNTHEVQSNKYISEKGEIVSFSLAHVLLHELVHAVLGQTDFPAGLNDYPDLMTPGFDYVGDTVRTTNSMLPGLNEATRSSYSGTLSVNRISDLGFGVGGSLTEGRKIDVAIVNNKNFQAIDISDRNDNTLVVGSDHFELITGGQASDTIYGAGGNDEIEGLAGIDWIYGGKGNDVLVGGKGVVPADLVNFDSPNTDWEDGVMAP